MRSNRKFTVLFLFVPQKNYVQLQEVIQTIQINDKLSASFAKYQSIVRSSLIVLRFHITDPNQNAIANAFNAFGDLMRMSSQCNDFEKFMDIWSMLQRKSDLEQTIKLLINKETTVPVRKWLGSLTDSLLAAIAKDAAATPKVEEKVTFVQLTALLLMYVQLEVAHPMADDNQNKNRFDESMKFLVVCMSIKRLHEVQYRTCFTLLHKFIGGLRSPTEFPKACENIYKEIR